MSEQRGCEGRVLHRFRGVRLERCGRGGLERDVPDTLALAVGAGIPDAPERVVVDEGLDEVAKWYCVGNREREVPDRRLVHSLLHEV